MSETTWLDELRSIAVAKKQRKQRSDKGCRSAEQLERICEMSKLRDNGATLQAIGGIYGISRERVRQLLKHFAAIKAAGVGDEN